MAVTEKVLIDACKEFIADFLDAYHEDNDKVVMYRMKDTPHPSRQETAQKEPTDDNDNNNDNDTGTPSDNDGNQSTPNTSPTNDKGNCSAVYCNDTCGTTAAARVGCYAHRFGADGSGRSRRLCLLKPDVRAAIRERFNRYRNASAPFYKKIYEHRHRLRTDATDDSVSDTGVTRDSTGADDTYSGGSSSDTSDNTGPRPHRSWPFHHFVPQSNDTNAAINSDDISNRAGHQPHRQEHQEGHQRRPAWVLPIGYYDAAIDRFVYAVRCPAHFIADFAMRVVLLPYLLEQLEEPSLLNANPFVTWVRALQSRLDHLRETHKAIFGSITQQSSDVSRTNNLSRHVTVEDVLGALPLDYTQNAFRLGLRWCESVLWPLQNTGAVQDIGYCAYVIRSDYLRRSEERGDDWPQLAKIVVSASKAIRVPVSKKPDRLYCLDRGPVFGWNEYDRNCQATCWNSRETPAFVRWLSGVSKWSPLSQSVPQRLWTALVVAFGASPQHCRALAAQVGMSHTVVKRDMLGQYERFWSGAENMDDLKEMVGTKVVICGDVTMSFSDLYLSQTGTSTRTTTPSRAPGIYPAGGFDRGTTTSTINTSRLPIGSSPHQHDQHQHAVVPYGNTAQHHGGPHNADNSLGCEDDANDAEHASSITGSLPMSQEVTPIASSALGPAAHPPATIATGERGGCFHGVDRMGAHEPMRAIAQSGHSHRPPQPSRSGTRMKDSLHVTGYLQPADYGMNDDQGPYTEEGDEGTSVEKVLIDACKEFIADFLDAYHKDNHKDNDKVVYRMKDPSRQETAQKKPTDDNDSDNDSDHDTPNTSPTSKIAHASAPLKPSDDNDDVLDDARPTDDNDNGSDQGTTNTSPTSTDTGCNEAVNCSLVCGTTACARVGCYAHRFGADGSGRSRRLCLLEDGDRAAIRKRFNGYRNASAPFYNEIYQRRHKKCTTSDGTCPHRSGPFQHFVPQSDDNNKTINTDDSNNDTGHHRKLSKEQRDYRRRPAWVLPIGYYDATIDRFVYAVRCPAHFIADFAMRVVLLPYLLEQSSLPPVKRSGGGAQSADMLLSLQASRGNAHFTLWVNSLKARLREHPAGGKRCPVWGALPLDYTTDAFRLGLRWCDSVLWPALQSSGAVDIACMSEFEHVLIDSFSYVIQTDYERLSKERGDVCPQLSRIVVSVFGTVHLPVSKKLNVLFCLDRGPVFGWNEYNGYRSANCWNSQETPAFVQWLAGVSKWSPLSQSVPKLLWTALVVAFGASSKHCRHLAEKVGIPNDVEIRDRKMLVEISKFWSSARNMTELKETVGTEVVTCGDVTMSFSDLHLSQTTSIASSNTTRNTTTMPTTTATTTTTTSSSGHRNLRPAPFARTTTTADATTTVMCAINTVPQPIGGTPQYRSQHPNTQRSLALPSDDHQQILGLPLSDDDGPRGTHNTPHTTAPQNTSTHSNSDGDGPHSADSDNDRRIDCEDGADSAGQASITCSLHMSQEATPIASPALGPTTDPATGGMGCSLRGCFHGMGSADEPKHTIAHIPLQANSHMHSQQTPEPVLLNQPQQHTGRYAERPPVTGPSSQEEAPAAHPQTASQIDPGPDASAASTSRKRSDRSASFASECETSRGGPRMEDSKRTSVSMRTAITESPAPLTINLVSSGAAGGHRRLVPSPLRRLPTVIAVAGAGTFEFYSDGLFSRVHTTGDQQPWALLSTCSVQAQGADILVYGFVRTTEAVGLSWWIPHDLGPIHLADSEASADTSFILRIPPASTLVAGQQYAVCLGTAPASRSDVLGEISFTIQDIQTASENYHGPEATPHGAATGTCRSRGDRNASRSGPRSEGSADARPPQPQPPTADPSVAGTVTASTVVHTAAVEAEAVPLRPNEMMINGRRHALKRGRDMWGYYWPGWYRYAPVNPDGSLDLDTPSLDEATGRAGQVISQATPVMPPVDAAPTAAPPVPPAPEAPRGQFPTHCEIQMAIARAQRRRGWAV